MDKKIILKHDPTIKFTELTPANYAQGAGNESKLSDLFARFQQFTLTDETMAEYQAGTHTQRTAWKNVGGFVLAEFVNSYRCKNNFVKGYGAVLDIEKMFENTGTHVTTDDIIDKIKSLTWCAAWYSSHSHTPDDPRFRIIFPFSRPATAEETEFLTRYAANRICMAWTDPKSFNVGQLMFWPSSSKDATPIYGYCDGDLLDVDLITAGYTAIWEDWRNRSHWPRFSNESPLRDGVHLSDPKEKKGVVGAFCRTYDVYRVMEEIIPGVYEETAVANRFSYSAGSGADGAVVYDDFGNGTFLYSHHSTDPANGQNNAFDLMRKHLYGHLDADMPANTSMSEMPSYIAACDYAKSLPDVSEELEQERREQAAEDFAGLEMLHTDNALPNGSGLVKLSDVTEKSPEWLVDGYIPRNEITIMAGDGGVGKTFAWGCIAAAVSSGKKCFLLDGKPESAIPDMPREVLFFSSEDSVSSVLLPRLRMNGADTDHIFTIDSSDADFSKIQLNSSYLEKLLAEYRPALCIFDPIQSFLPRGVNMIARNDMRVAMSKLHVFGEKYGTTFLIIVHTNKKTEVSGRNRLADSADIWDIARSVLIVGRVDAKGATRYISHEKSSYGKESDTVLFRIDSNNTVNFCSYTDKRDRDFVQTLAKETRSAPAKESATQFIIDYLTEHGESRACDLDEEAKIYFAAHTIRDAKADLKKSGKISIRAANEGKGKGVTWFISLSS